MQRKAQVTMLADGALVHDATRLGARVEPGWLEADYWRAQGPVHEPSGGRGAALLVRTPAGEAVLRHYRRGGLVAHFNPDRYRWRDQASTRPFREFALLQSLVDAGLPAPVPLAARYRRDRGWYQADLLTLAIEGAETLAQRLRTGPATIDWAQLGNTVARFHAHGVFHADLNAHNVLICGGRMHLIDFDRGERRAPSAAWQQANLARLKRSLEKLDVARVLPDFVTRAWPVLCAAHAQALGAGPRA
jgi:3-deoxy-D-manno-octulosonic acid kinase